MVHVSEVSGYDALRGVISSTKNKLYILFFADRIDGVSWCPDCVKAEPTIRAALDTQSVKDNDITFVTCFVGPKDVWKDQGNPFRTSPDIVINCVPSLIEYGRLDRRLIDSECADLTKVTEFLSE